MTLEGAINFHEDSNYTIYTMNSEKTGQFCAVLPKDGSQFNMLVDLRFKKSFDLVSSGGRTKAELTNEIGDEYKNLQKKYAGAILVLPMFPEDALNSIINSLDKQKMFDETKRIGAITSEIYRNLTEHGVEKQKIDQTIIIVEKTDEDKKYVSWLKEQMPNFVEGVDYSELSPKVEASNPFMGGDLFGSPAGGTTVQEASTSSVAPNIFEQAAPKVEPVTEPATLTETSIFGSESNAPVNNGTVNDNGGILGSTEPINVNNNDFFGTPSSPSATPTEPVSPNVAAEQSAPEVKPVSGENDLFGSSVSQNEVPKPVTDSPLEGTTTFSPIPNVEATPAAAGDSSSLQSSQVSNVESQRKSNGGFVNLIILGVILIVVTIVSIELGKFLYSVYGA